MSSEFTVHTIDQESIKETAKLVVREFNAREPIAQLNASNSDDFYEYILGVCRKCADEGLGFIARDTLSNKIIGAALSADLAYAVNAEPPEDDEDVNPVATLVSSLNSLHFTNGELAENTYLNIKFIAADANFKGKGVVMDLISACIEEGKARGFKYAQAEATGNVSQYIFMNKFGFEEKAIIKYSEFEFDGGTPFSSITEHEGIKLLIKSI
jgi:ribosomal protein S18 acetylase RimI-like enzyme